MNVIVPLFFLLGTLWFAIQLFGQTVVGWIIGIGVALWLLVWLGGWVLYAVSRWQDFFARLALSSGYAIGAMVVGCLALPFGLLILSAFFPVLVGLPSSTGDMYFQIWAALIFIVTFVFTWRWAGRQQALEAQEAKEAREAANVQIARM